MHHKSKTYKSATCCSEDCTYAHSSTEEEPCWGEVEVVDEVCTEDYSDCWWIHACEGHRDLCEGGKYIKEL